MYKGNINAWYGREAFNHQLKGVITRYYNSCIRLFSLKGTFYVCSAKRSFFKRPFYVTFLTYVKRIFMKVC